MQPLISSPHVFVVGIIVLDKLSFKKKGLLFVSLYLKYLFHTGS